jgi:hypothetical protein
MFQFVDEDIIMSIIVFFYVVYCRQNGEPDKAEGFLLDVIKLYKAEGWEMLADEVRLDLAFCQLSSEKLYK